MECSCWERNRRRYSTKVTGKRERTQVARSKNTPMEGENLVPREKQRSKL